MPSGATTTSPPGANPPPEVQHLFGRVQNCCKVQFLCLGCVRPLLIRMMGPDRYDSFPVCKTFGWGHMSDCFYKGWKIWWKGLPSKRWKHNATRGNISLWWKNAQYDYLPWASTVIYFDHCNGKRIGSWALCKCMCDTPPGEKFSVWFAVFWIIYL